MDHLQYLLVLGACLLVTFPLELTGSRVYRQPVRLARAIVPAAVVFLVWDVLAIRGGVWDYDPRFLVRLTLPFGVPLEEVLFFVVVPVCGLLTFETVERLLPPRAGNEPGARR